MPMETKGTVDPHATESIQIDLVKVSTDIVGHLVELLTDTRAYVIPPQGQASLSDLASTAMEKMLRYVREVESMEDDNFMLVDGPQRAAQAEVRAKAKAEAEKRAAVERKLKAEAKAKAKAEAERAEHAKGHEGREAVHGSQGQRI